MENLSSTTPTQHAHSQSISDTLHNTTDPKQLPQTDHSQSVSSNAPYKSTDPQPMFTNTLYKFADPQPTSNNANPQKQPKNPSTELKKKREEYDNELSPQVMDVNDFSS
ncbi:9635_t:CDS:2 [Racocetra fulgida]|uniref:9635_t:CDS:1 n=1 Tax=Racocetra fulgida TaxID=60492 RepID=A0A9N9FMG6_9GLOM|nr:9635_t:CDS:2 [Racocetra fulgida]